MLNVHILTTYNGHDDIFGSTCVFDSVRVGFPNANITVHDNSSTATDIISERAGECGASYNNLEEKLPHDEWIKSIIKSGNGDSIVFLDPDVIFYGSVERKLEQLNTLVAGRYCPHYYNAVVGANEIDRLHTSLLYIPNPTTLMSHLNRVISTRNFPFDPFKPFVFKATNKSFFYDTCANLFHATSDSQAFEEDILDCYSHLVSGSMLDFVASKLPFGNRLKALHKQAQTDPNSVRGLWRQHDKFYTENPWR